MGSIAAITFVAALTGTTVPAPAVHHLSPRAVTRERAPRAFSAPIVAYSGTPASPDPVAAERDDATVGAFSDVATYAAFEPEERTVLPSVTRRETFLARVRKAASRILSVATRMPRF